VHIGVDGSLWGGEESGVAAATRRLFVKLSENPGPHRLTVFVNRWAIADLGPAPQHTRIVVVSSGRRGARVAWQQLRLPALARAHGLDLLYNPCYTAPLASRVPLAVTIHDLIAWRRPELCRLTNVLHLRTLLGLSARRARVITVPTAAVARDVVERLGVRAAKVHVVAWGADFEIRPLPREAARAAVREWYGIDRPYVLHVGALEPKKNLVTLRRALRDSNIALVLAGPRGWQRGSVRREILSGGDGTCHHLGWVPVERLGALYAAAELFAFPSHIEGFGLPVLEAMACGTPVIASDAPALLEVCGGAALHAAPDDAGGWSQAIRLLLEDGPLREQLVERGRVRASQFTWERARTQFLSSIDDAVQRSEP
jgi:glycosyltransferase involved in cell wall biosynthesis